MSRYDEAASSNASTNRGNNYDQTEAPLPSYDEVVGGPSDNPNLINIGFKTDVLLPASSNSSPDQGQSSSNRDSPNHQNEGFLRLSNFKPSRTGAILVLLGMILIPMCGMIIILQVKFCASDQSQLQQSVDKINASYSDCTIELSSLQETLDSNENRIRDLQYQVEELNNQKQKLQQMLNSIEE